MSMAYSSEQEQNFCRRSTGDVRWPKQKVVQRMNPQPRYLSFIYTRDDNTSEVVLQQVQ